MMKNVVGVHHQPKRHWVGDGFHVRSLFSYEDYGRHLNPFLLLDYAAPTDFPPTSGRRGVGQHPHRGFETVTIVYQGELEHRDSSGGGGIIGPGDVQWMTAGAGILHDEFHSPDFGRSGGTLEMVQLWVNLPASDKKAPPRYQTLHDRDIPVVELPDEAGRLRVIAGEYAGAHGPAATHSPLDVWDVRLEERCLAHFRIAEGRPVALIVLRGTIRANGTHEAHESEWVMLGRVGENVSIEALDDATVLLLSGQPLDEPIVGHGPFVMNSRREIEEAIDDFNSGRFGELKTPSP